MALWVSMESCLFSGMKRLGEFLVWEVEACPQASQYVYSWSCINRKHSVINTAYQNICQATGRVHNHRTVNIPIEMNGLKLNHLRNNTLLFKNTLLNHNESNTVLSYIIITCSLGKPHSHFDSDWSIKGQIFKSVYSKARVAQFI